MKQKIRKLNKNIEIVFTDSKDPSITNNEWLPGRVITLYWGNIVGLIDKQTITIDKLGK